MEIPPEIIVLIVLCLGAAGGMTWVRRGEYGGAEIGRIWAVLEDYVAQTLLLVMIVAATIQVSARYFLAGKLVISWTEELALLAMVWLAFWGAASVHRQQEHISLSLLFDRFGVPVQRLLLIFVDLVTIAVLVPIVWFGFDNARWLDIMSTVAIGVPLSTFAYSVPVAVGLMVVHSVVHLAGHIRSPMTAPRHEIDRLEEPV